MIAIAHMRRCEVWRLGSEDKPGYSGGYWFPVRMEQIETGDIFRLFDADGTPFKGADGSSVWRAEGIATVPCEAASDPSHPK